MTNPWLDPSVSQQQRALVDRQLAEKPWPPHFVALAEAMRATQCPGEILLIGCGPGHEREVLDRAGVAYRSFAGVDISPEAIRLAKERYPESDWRCGYVTDGGVCVWSENEYTNPGAEIVKADVVVDGSCVLHADLWQDHLAALCGASRRFVILHRIPLGPRTMRIETQGYGHTFPAWRFNGIDIHNEMGKNGFVQTSAVSADGDSHTLTYARPRHWATYCDSAYLLRLKALHASMVRHCSPFELHVLAWDDEVKDWCFGQNIDYLAIEDFLYEHPRLASDALPGPKRTRVEHMWTIGAAYLLSVLERVGEPVTYCDSDILFFSSPEPVFAEIGGASAAVVPHGFAEASRGLPGPTKQTHHVFGTFNCGILYAAERLIVERWAEQTRQWCYDRLEQSSSNPEDYWAKTNIKYGDQKFLDEWPDQGARVITRPGACAGPWQIHTRALDVRNGVIHFGNRPLVAYHFSGLKLGPHGQDQLTRPEYMLSERQAEIIYAPYLRALQEAK